MEKTQNFKNTVFACYRGYITQGIVNNLSPLFFVLFQNKFGISYSLISALILCNFVTQVITDNCENTEKVIDLDHKKPNL